MITVTLAERRCGIEMEQWGSAVALTLLNGCRGVRVGFAGEKLTMLLLFASELQTNEKLERKTSAKLLRKLRD